MSYLGYKTRGGAKPQGKPRVLFACYQQDFDLYFDTISNELFKISDCTIYYVSDYKAVPKSEDELDLDFSLMNLVVFPITEGFLLKPSFARDTILPFVENKHIPILPIFCEETTDKTLSLYSKYFGNAQYLDKKSKDETAISYEDKLKRFVSSVLVGDETAKKIRESFDGYIFLSYRKKDRKYAKELMQLIHKNENCRDMAIWYDEFLVPGESFSDSISTALGKSKMFALVVTPNLVNEQNYISTVEFPMAKKSKKNILPAELVKTDAKLLKQQYDGIPPKIDPRDKSAFDTAIEKALEGVERMSKAGVPDHDYLIGLAYMGGVDVEVDTQRAITLIESAANAGVYEAILKMADIYSNGEGVKRDYQLAIKWLEKAVKRAKQIYKAKKDADSLFDYADSCMRLGACQNSMGKTGKAIATCKEGIKACQQAIGKFKGSNSEMALASSILLGRLIDSLGRIYMKSGKLKDARACYTDSLKIREKNRKILSFDGANDLSDYYNLYEIANSHASLGEIAIGQGRLNDAQASYQDAIGYYLDAIKIKGEDDVRNSLSIAYNKVASIWRAAGEFRVAESYFKKSIEVAEDSVREFGSIAALENLAISNNDLGELYNYQGRSVQGRPYFEKALRIFEKLARETATPYAKRELATAYNNMGATYQDEGRQKESESCYLKNMEICEALVKEVGTIEDQRSLGISYNNIASLYSELGKQELSLQYHKKSIQIREKVRKETDALWGKRDLTLAYNNVACLYKEKGDSKNAYPYFVKALEGYEELARITDTFEDKQELGSTYVVVGSLLEEMEKYQEALSYYKKASAFLEKLGAKAPQEQVYMALALALGGIYYLTGDRAMLPKLENAYKKLVSINPYNQDYHRNLYTVRQQM
ncbi:MAG: tetratricopeptide repeat protein [Clostridia bacterium]|nr:tetratricopeptide repeat protein [Clostridia bacterium]MBQ7907785.1 tetratricopeptide repeat protein [Clostridia bacterium]